MKSLLIIRHAKSSWDLSTIKDFDRPLNERGHKDAPAMAKRLVEKQIHIDAFVSSTAKRAFTTACYFAEAYHIKEKQVQRIDKLYHAAEPVFYEVISALDNSLNTVAIFSHNPGITYFVNELTNAQIDDMPTCGIFAIHIDSDNWADFKKAKKTFWFFDYPKNLGLACTWASYKAKSIVSICP
jgi:phosphohistidine phosphatase